jgi:hypothetical protein
MKLQRRLAVVAAASILATGLVVPAVQAAEKDQQANNPLTTSSDSIVGNVEDAIATVFLARVFGPAISSCIANNDTICEFI